MRRSIAAGVLALAATILPGHAASRDFGIGVSLGSPMGLTALQNFGQTEAVQAALEWGVYGTFVAHLDWIFKNNQLFQFDPQYGKAWIYYGPGLRVEIGDRDITPFGPYFHSDDARIALRFPSGVQYYIPKAPFDVFFEVAPMLGFWEATTLDLTVALGVRFDL